MCRGCKRTAGPVATAMFGVPGCANKTPGDTGTDFASNPMDTAGLKGEGHHHDGPDGAGECAALAAYCCEDRQATGVRPEPGDGGEVIRIATANVTAVGKCIHDLAARQGVTLIQEVSAPLHALPGLEGAFAAKGAKALLGPPDPHAGKAAGGVGIVAGQSRAVRRLCPIEKKGDLADAIAAGRVDLFAVDLPGGLPLVAYSIYLWAGSS